MKAYTFLLFFQLSLAISAQHMLHYNLKVDDTFKVEQQAHQYITQDISGVDQIIENNLKSAMQFKVVKVGQESITLEMVFTHLKMTMSSPTLGIILHADTEITDTNDMTSQMFKGILNIPVTLIMDKTGKIKSVSGGDKLIASMFKIANISDSATIEANKGQFEKQFGSEALSNSFEQMTYFLPAKLTRVNDTWENTYKGDLQAQNKWTLIEYTDSTYTVSGLADVTMSNTDVNVNMVLLGTQQTTINANLKTGIFKDIIVVGDYVGNTQINANNMTIPTKITSTITYKLLN